MHHRVLQVNVRRSTRHNINNFRAFESSTRTTALLNIHPSRSHYPLGLMRPGLILHMRPPSAKPARSWSRAASHMTTSQRPSLLAHPRSHHPTHDACLSLLLLLHYSRPAPAPRVCVLTLEPTLRVKYDLTSHMNMRVHARHRVLQRKLAKRGFCVAGESRTKHL